MKGKLIVLSAPSGSGKSTIINHILRTGLPVEFSISATSRPARGNEKEGVDYYFLTPEVFKEKIKAGAFLEYEEVYPAHFYGTLKSEMEDRLNRKHNVLLDVDVAGGLTIKGLYGENALLIFIRPPSVEELRRRLEKRGTDTPEIICNRVSKAEYELSLASRYDTVIVNDDLERAKKLTIQTIVKFITL